MQFNIIHQDAQKLIVNKPGGLLSQRSSNNSDPGLIDLLSEQLNVDCHILTRLDRPVSGLTVIALNKQFIRFYEDRQTNKKIVKTYLAIVEGSLEIDSLINNYGFHDRKKHKSIISREESPGGKLMSSHFKTLLLLDRYSVIQVEIHRGKFHQIRAQLSHLGHPIKGDLKYGAKRRKGEPFICLHAYSIEWPCSDEHIERYYAPLPKNVDLWGLVAEKLKLKEDG